MPKIYPEKFPAHKAKNPRLQAEEITYHALYKSLGDRYTVLYSIPWQAVDPANRLGNVRDNEIDFLIAHPEHGLLVLEIKGGGIEYDARKDAFYSHTAKGDRETIQNPYEQAKKNKHHLLAALKEHAQWDKHFVALGHAAVFPATRKLAPGQGLAFPAEITIYGDDFAHLAERIEALYAYYRPKGADKTRPLGHDRIQTLVDLFAKSFKLPISQKRELKTVNEKITELTEEQFTLLDFLATHRRARIKGGAGSGKTMLALEKARRLARLGCRTLFVCFNRALCEYLQEINPGRKQLEIHTFHTLCADFGRFAGLIQESIQSEDPVYYAIVLPEVFKKSLTKLERRYDAILVDEAQDFLSNWWEPLMASLVADGIFYIFYDDYQQLRKGVTTIYPVRDEPFLLTRNLRNTRQIHAAATKYMPPDLRLDAFGPAGRDVERVTLQNVNQQLLPELERILRRLIFTENISSKDIVVLTGKGVRESLLYGVERAGDIPLSFGKPKIGTVRVDTVRRFKGLESAVVILVEVEEAVLREAEVMYIGLTRARAHLIVIGVSL